VDDDRCPSHQPALGAQGAPRATPKNRCLAGGTGRLQSAELDYLNATLSREVAEISLKQYLEGVYRDDNQITEAEVASAKSDLARAVGRVAWAERMSHRGCLSQAQKIARETTIKELKWGVEKSRADELAKKATLDTVRRLWTRTGSWDEADR